MLFFGLLTHVLVYSNTYVDIFVVVWFCFALLLVHFLFWLRSSCVSVYARAVCMSVLGNHFLHLCLPPPIVCIHNCHLFRVIFFALLFLVIPIERVELSSVEFSDLQSLSTRV